MRMLQRLCPQPLVLLLEVLGQVASWNVLLSISHKEEKRALPAQLQNGEVVRSKSSGANFHEMLRSLMCPPPIREMRAKCQNR